MENLLISKKLHIYTKLRHLNSESIYILTQNGVCTSENTYELKEFVITIRLKLYCLLSQNTSNRDDLFVLSRTVIRQWFGREYFQSHYPNALPTVHIPFHITGAGTSQFCVSRRQNLKAGEL